MFFRWMKLLAPILLVISFLLPWFSASTSAASGFQISLQPEIFSSLFHDIQTGTQTVDSSVSMGMQILFYSLWLIPVLSVLSLVLVVLDKPTKLINILLSLYAFAVIIYCWWKLQFSSLFFDILSMGMYLMIAMSVLLFISTIADREDYLYDED